MFFVFTGKFMTHEELDRNRTEYADLTARYQDSWFHHERYIAQLMGDAATNRTDLHPDYRFANYHVHRTCTTCQMPERYHDAAKCAAARAQRRCEFLPSCIACGKRARRGARNAKWNGTGRRAENDDDEDDEDDEDDDDDDDEEEEDARFCTCRVFTCYDIDLREHAASIQTPYEDGILKHQWGHFADFVEVYYWFWVMIGRWLFPLDSTLWDDWQKLTCVSPVLECLCVCADSRSARNKRVLRAAAASCVPIACCCCIVRADCVLLLHRVLLASGFWLLVHLACWLRNFWPCAPCVQVHFRRWRDGQVCHWWRPQRLCPSQYVCGSEPKRPRGVWVGDVDWASGTDADDCV